MPNPAPDKATRILALRLTKGLARLKSDWASEPTLTQLSPSLIAALQHGVEEVELQRSTVAWGCLIVGGLLYIGGGGITHISAWAALIGCALLYLKMTSYIEHTQRYMVYALTQTQELSVLPTLVLATAHAWGRDPAVLAAIRRLLEQATEQDAGLLNHEAQDTLWNLAVLPLTLRRNADEALAFSALEAFARIGDRETLTAMQRLADHAAVYPIEHRLNERLQELLPRMEARLQRQQSLQTLLRASDIAASKPDTLLRSHVAPPSEARQQLLRAGREDSGTDEAA